MRIGASLFLIAVGAVLKFAQTKPISGVSVGVVGVISMIVGIVGLLITLVLLNTCRCTDMVYGRSRATYVEPINPLDPRY